MNALPTLGSVDLVPATTHWATTPVCVPLSTCRSTEETTAWVSGETSLRLIRTYLLKNKLKK